MQSPELIQWILAGLNLATIITGVASFGKLIWWLSKADSRIDDARATAVRAHKRIDKITDDHEGD